MNVEIGGPVIFHISSVIKISSGPWPKKEDWLKKKNRNQRRPGFRRKKASLKDGVSSYLLGPCLSLSLSRPPCFSQLHILRNSTRLQSKLIKVFIFVQSVGKECPNRRARSSFSLLLGELAFRFLLNTSSQ